LLIHCYKGIVIGMVYPTPGFVVRNSFLEIEPEGEEYEQESDDGHQPALRRRRAYSDGEIVNKERFHQVFGSEEIQLWWQQKCEDRGNRGSRRCHSSTGHASAASHRVGAETEERSKEARKWHDISEGEDPDDDGSISGDGDVSCSSDNNRENPRENTTLYIEKVPADYTRVLFANTLDKEGFAGTYDFLFVGMDLRTRVCNGFALVNFRSNALALRALECFKSFDRWLTQSSQLAVPIFSEYYQGMDELIERHRNSPIMHGSVPDIYKPVLFDANGKLEKFPQPTRQIRVPRVRKLKANARNRRQSRSRPRQSRSRPRRKVDASLQMVCKDDLAPLAAVPMWSSTAPMMFMPVMPVSVPVWLTCF
jgi:hypothetical protein